MTSEEAYALSFYREVAVLDTVHSVFLVQHTKTGRKYVKKVLTVYDADIYRFLKGHPIGHIPRIEEAVEDAGTLIVIEEYIDGVSLADVLEKEGTLPEDRVISIIQKLCRILNELHSLNPPIIHRDIKPSNIMLCENDEVVLLDMNAAKRADIRKERDTVLIGTHGYAAPEQYGFASSGVETDIYALGILMNEMLTGKPSRTNVPAGFWGRIIRKCTAIDPQDRYQSTREVTEALSSRFTQESAGQERYNRYALPGFRNGNPKRMLLAGIGYLLLIVICCVLQVEGAPPAMVPVYRIITGLMIFLAVLFSCNYLDIWNVFRINTIRNRRVRIIAVMAGNVFIIAVCMFVLFIFEQIL